MNKNERAELSMFDTIDAKLICSWTNGRKANVCMVEHKLIKKIIKRYKLRFILTMFRGYILTLHLSRKLEIIPKVIEFRPFRKEIVFTYLPGERVFEWVLSRYGSKGIKLEDFQSYDYLNTCVIVEEAFRKFRECRNPEALKLKKSIRKSYEELHKTKFVHGSADPRNIIYNGENIFIIDFDHSRPSINPVSIDYRSLKKWYGILPE